MHRSEFEDVLILDTPYYRNLKKTYRDTVNFNRYITILKEIAKNHGFISMLEKRGGKELVYLGRKIFSLQEEFITNYIYFLSDESTISKWEQFFERYSSNLFEIYKNFTAGDRNRILIFEIVNRKLLRDLLTKQTMNEAFDNKKVISERLGIVVNQLFNYIRNSLTKDITQTDTLIIDAYKKIPLLPRCNPNETMKLLSNCFLRAGLPGPLVTALSKNIITAYYVETKEKIIKLISKKAFLAKSDIREIFQSHFFFPDEESLSEVLVLLKTKASNAINITKKKRDMIAQRTMEMKRKSNKTVNIMKERLINLTRNFSSEESIDNIIKKLRRHLVTNGYRLRDLKNEHDEYVQIESELHSILSYKTHDLLTFISKNEWDPYIILMFDKEKTIADDQLHWILKDVMNEIKNDKKAMEIMNKYRVSGFLKEKVDTAAINRQFHVVTDEVILPLVISFLVEELIEYYPKLSGVVPGEGVRYLAEEALSGRVSLVEKDIHVVSKDHDVSGLYISRYKSLVSALIYDIRGSTFMGTKLLDAKRESEIRNLFQESMLSTVEKYGGMPIKDTGDGGIVLFAENHLDIKNDKTLCLEAGSTLPAVRSALEMIQGAKNFVQENIDKYQDWFRKAAERSVDFEGATYATLPPQYQSIFQIGIGIASGTWPKEIYLDKNAYGELDLTGMLVREANFYSKVKAKSKSTVICDDTTVYNLLLNVNKFSFLSETGLRIDPLLLDIEQGLEYWINQKITKRGFILDLYKIFVTQLGQEISRPGSLKIMLGIYDIAVDETGEIKDEKGGRGKFLFELSSEAAI